ncbi:hypothetical protein [Curtobacterium sp. MCBA15_005]|uniref:hypothetical protein n=1 Tax=Curtobacterium sp. MCBA15_005 TaxID=1898734 RepID=UPI0008DCFE46|nr:hypothetical protein BIU89_01700 [Curtobacterium sp. MCBA15_005]
MSFTIRSSSSSHRGFSPRSFRYRLTDDRRGLYTELTHAGQVLLERATPIHAAALEGALAEAHEVPELADLAESVERLEGARV